MIGFGARGEAGSLLRRIIAHTGRKEAWALRDVAQGEEFPCVRSLAHCHGNPRVRKKESGLLPQADTGQSESSLP